MFENNIENKNNRASGLGNIKGQLKGLRIDHLKFPVQHLKFLNTMDEIPSMSIMNVYTLHQIYFCFLS